jgi:hypothetical protein
MGLEALKDYAAHQEAPEDKNDVIISDFKPVNNISNINPLPGNKTALKQPKNDIEGREKSRKAYANYQKNILKSGGLRSEITKDIYEGKDLSIILLKAIECISLMTNDKLFYSSNKDKLKKWEI